MRNWLKRVPGWLVVLALGVVLIVVGICQGDFQETLRKAALVCYECIGIG